MKTILDELYESYSHDPNEVIRAVWANLGEKLFNSYGMKQYWALEEALSLPLLWSDEIEWGVIEYEELKKQEEVYRQKRAGNYPPPPVIVNLAGKQDFLLASFSFSVKRIKDGKELPIPNDSNFSITFPRPLKEDK